MQRSPESFQKVVRVSFDSPIVDSYQCMSDVIRRVFVTPSVSLEDSDGSIRIQSRSGFIALDDVLVVLSSESLGEKETSVIEATFVCMTLDLPSRVFKDAFPGQLEPIEVTQKTIFHSSPCMLFSWSREDTLAIRGDDVPEPDCHADVSQAASRITKYMRVARPLETGTVKVPTGPVEPIRVDLSRKKPKDAREFREQIIANGAQAEFYVWSLIKARYGDAADLSWWLTSAKRTYFTTDVTPVDDSIGSDFFIPKDTQCLFASKRGGPVHIEVKGTGRFCGANDHVTFEISRNELQAAEDAKDRGEEYVVAVVSGLAGINRPKLETVIRDLSQVSMVPTRFLATVPKSSVSTPSGDNPLLTRSSWY